MSQSKQIRQTALVAALASIYPLQALASAGVAQFSVGEVQVRRAAATTPLANGSRIESGDQILTGGTGRAQLRFTDGGMVSLQPNSQFTISKYVDAADSKQDSFLVDLARGGMRTITGLIGKRNRDNFKVTTTTATIGIRGSGFSLSYNPDGTLAVSTELDAIEVCTQAGCIGLNVGEHALVSNAAQLPARVRERAHWNPPTPRRAVNARTEDVDNTAQSAYIPVSAPAPAPAPGPILSSGLALTAAGMGEGGSPRLYLDGTSIKEQSGITGYLGKNNDRATGTAEIQSETGSLSAGDLMILGKWSSVNWTGEQPGSVTNQGFALGSPTPQAAREAASGMRGQYNLTAGTPVFASSGSNGTLLSSSNVTVDFRSAFAAMDVKLDIEMPIQIQTGSKLEQLGETAIASTRQFALRGSGTVVDGGFSGALAATQVMREQSAVAIETAPVQPAISSSSSQVGVGSFKGFVGGPTAGQLGLSYSAALGEGGGDISIAGAGVFTKGTSGDIPTQNAGIDYNNTRFLLQVMDGSNVIGSESKAGVSTTHQTYQCSSSTLVQASFSGTQLRSWTANSWETSFNALPSPDLQPVRQYGAVGQPSDNSFIGWGAWDQAEVRRQVCTTFCSVQSQALDHVHYLIGKSTFLGYGASEFSGSATTRYAFIGGTNPTATPASGPTVTGTINPNTSHLVVNFTAARTVQANLDLTFGSTAVEFRGTGSFDQSASRINSSSTDKFSGMFVGNHAERAGIVYGTTHTTLGTIRGAAVFQTSTPPSIVQRNP